MFPSLFFQPLIREKRWQTVKWSMESALARSCSMSMGYSQCRPTLLFVKCHSLCVLAIWLLTGRHLVSRLPAPLTYIMLISYCLVALVLQVFHMRTWQASIPVCDWRMIAARTLSWTSNVQWLNIYLTTYSPVFVRLSATDEEGVPNKSWSACISTHKWWLC